MRPGILYDLSQRLAVLLEDGLRGTRGEPKIPVLICHPLDPIENKENLQGGTVGVLYPVRVSPESRLRAASLALETGFTLERGQAGEDLKERIRLPGLWLRVRYLFLLAGGTVENQLGAIAAALRTLHDHPLITLGPAGAEGGGQRTEDSARSSQGAASAGERRGPPDETSREGGPEEAAQGSFPLRILEDCEGWRELGLSEHRLTISFEVTIPLASERSEPVERIFERELEIEEGPK
jgi:hypothetical protein